MRATKHKSTGKPRGRRGARREPRASALSQGTINWSYSPIKTQNLILQTPLLPPRLPLNPHRIIVVVRLLSSKNGRQFLLVHWKTSYQTWWSQRLRWWFVSARTHPRSCARTIERHPRIICFRKYIEKTFERLKLHKEDTYEKHLGIKTENQRSVLWVQIER